MPFGVLRDFAKFKLQFNHSKVFAGDLVESRTAKSLDYPDKRNALNG